VLPNFVVLDALVTRSFQQVQHYTNATDQGNLLRPLNDSNGKHKSSYSFIIH
jgi:hypothetical protein